MHGSAEFYLGATATPPDAGLFAFAFAANCTETAVNLGAYCADVGPQEGNATGALLRLEAYLDDVSGTRPSAGLVHPIALLFTK